MNLGTEMKIKVSIERRAEIGNGLGRLRGWHKDYKYEIGTAEGQ